MEHYYENVYGWFNYQWFFNQAIDNALSGETIVEIGAFRGKSACYAGVEIANRRPDLRFVSVDHFEGMPCHRNASNPVFIPELLNNSDYLYMEYLRNTSPVSEWVQAWRLNSQKAHELVDDNSLAAVFIDGDHSYSGCYADIQNWLPKVRSGGFIGGHDYNWKGVKKAVTKAFSNNVTIAKRSWSFKLPN